MKASQPQSLRTPANRDVRDDGFAMSDASRASRAWNDAENRSASDEEMGRGGGRGRGRWDFFFNGHASTACLVFDQYRWLA